MYNINFSDTSKHIHFIGIGGISMSGLAELLLYKGFSVSGSDSKESPLTEQLRKKGATIYIGQSADNISASTDLVVMTAAIHPDNPELMSAKEKAIPVITRAELLGQVMKQYKQPAAVAGTHGKTTTTSMISELLLAADTDPTLSVGGILPAIGGNFKIGSSDFFVTEACEYTNSFLSFYPMVEIILNIDADHLDFFKDLDDIRASFRKFAQILPPEGTLIINGETENLDGIIESLPCQIITFGLNEGCDYYACDIKYDEYAHATFTAYLRGESLGSFTLGVPGEHNVYNALSVIAYARLYDIPMSTVQSVLKSFKGSNRRFEYKGDYNGITIIDDYAHHPTEIAATLKAAQNCPHKTLWCIFQPHTYTRTKSLLDDFARELSRADVVLLPDIYAARETDTLGISSEDLANAIKTHGTTAHYLPSFSEIKNFVKKNCSTGDMLITMGAGDVVNIGDELLAE